MDHIMGLMAGKDGELVKRLGQSCLSVARDAYHDLYVSMTETLDGDMLQP
jgi:hypothetical protein